MHCASNRRPPEFATRSQRAILRLAKGRVLLPFHKQIYNIKGFAALPKLQLPQREDEVQPGRIPLSRSTENLLASIQLPPRPTEIPTDYESEQVEELEEQFRHLGDDDGSELSPPSIISRNSSFSDFCYGSVEFL